MAGLDDRTVNLKGAPEQTARLGAVLGAPTRLAVLAALVKAEGPLNINELARRVGVDPSPVRTHLEWLAREGLAFEVEGGAGRERRFRTRLRDVRIVLEGLNRPDEGLPGPPSKAEAKLRKKRDALAKDMLKLEAQARKLEREIERLAGRRGPGGAG